MDAELAKLREAELEAYYASRKAEWDEFASWETAMKEGKREGIEIATRQIISNMLQQTSLSIKEIANFVNVPEKLVLEIKENE